jgi:hypothetical protein
LFVEAGLKLRRVNSTTWLKLRRAAGCASRKFLKNQEF